MEGLFRDIRERLRAKLKLEKKELENARKEKERVDSEVE